MLFKKFSKAEDVASSTKVKSSEQRKIRAKLLEQMPLLSEPVGDEVAGDTADAAAQATLLESIWPKKVDITLVKCREHISILALNGEPLFFQHFDGPFYPTLHLLHRYPGLLPHCGVDKGAIKFVLSGANIMCPGLTSKGGNLDQDVPTERAVAIHAEGKQHACAVGLTKMSTAEMKSINKGMGVENIHYLGDDLWALGRSGL